MNNLVGIYFLSINLLSGIVFFIDKKKAINGSRRIPEFTLHLLELFGGVFANVFLMYAIRHKNRKFSYWVWTWILGIGWMITIYLLIKNIFSVF
ncbi:MAG: DUF1294 domain-containing protein [Paludibacter sp.]